MVVCDTHAMIVDALDPARMRPEASAIVNQAGSAGDLACADISVWEIAMLLRKRRLTVDMEDAAFIRHVIAARRYQVLPITPEIALLAMSERFAHGDSADRLIGATAPTHHATLVTNDRRLRSIAGLDTVW